MTLYVKGGPEDGGEDSIGDCPFAHSIRMVLEEKGLEYKVQPLLEGSKPSWLVDFYEGKLPALRHRKECYVESFVIMEYLEFFFPAPVSLKPRDRSTEIVLDGFFPAVAQYLKGKEEEEEEDTNEKLENLQAKLSILEDHLLSNGGDAMYLCGDDQFTLLDCRLVPQLYHLHTASQEYKNGIPNLSESYPTLWKYYEAAKARPSFVNTMYPAETIIWGWGNARSE